jgi:hypothetical protein
VAEVLWLLIPVAACAGMLWLAARIEPHWVAKDGTRFLTTTQIIDRRGEPVGRRREMRLVIRPDGTVLAARRSLMRTNTQEFRLRAKSPNPPRRKAIYLLDPIPPDADGMLLTVRVPSNSRAVPELDRMLGVSSPGTAGSDRPAGPG